MLKILIKLIHQTRTNMAIKEQLKAIAETQGMPCVTISFNTHRTRPSNQKDELNLKNHVKEAEKRLLEEFPKNEITSLLDHLKNLDIDVNANKESIHIFVNNEKAEVIRSNWPVAIEGVFVDTSFAIRPLIKNFNREKGYYILMLTLKEVHLYEAENESIVKEVINDDFPFTEANYTMGHLKPLSDSERQDNKIRDFYNVVDKALQRVNHENEKICIVVSTEENFAMLNQVADYPAIYPAYFSIDFNKVHLPDVEKKAWEKVTQLQSADRTKLINEMKEAVSSGHVSTDLQEIYKAVLDGRGDLLIVHQDFQQPVRMTGDRTFDIIQDSKEPNALDDITSLIAWEVIKKKGQVIFTNQNEIKELGDIVLRTRY